MTTPPPAPPSAGATADARVRWNARFSEPGYLFGTAPNCFLASQAQRLRPGQRALAIVWLAAQGLDVTAVDFSPVALAKARALAEGAGVRLATIEADIGAWVWPEAAFDVVAAIFIQFAGPDLRAAMFRGIHATLRPGGLVILQGYRPEQLAYGTGGPPHAENMYTAALLRSAFADMEILHLAEHDSPLDEGAGHAGMSALVDLVARKP